MSLAFSTYVTLLLSCFILVLIFAYYWAVLRKISGFPIYHVFAYIVRYHMAKKKDIPFTNFLFQMQADMYKKHAKDGFCMTFSTNPRLYVFSEEPIKILYNEKAAMDKPAEYKVLRDGLGNGLITSNGERYKRHKKLILPAFQLGMLKEKIPLFNEHALALIEDLKTLQNKPSANIMHFVKRRYFNSLSESIFGLKQSKENKAEVVSYFNIVDKQAMMTMVRIAQPWLWPKFSLKLLPSGKKYLKMYDEGYKFTKNVILQMKKLLASNQEYDETEYFSKNLRKSFTYILLQYHLKDSSFTFDDLYGHVTTFMIAGYDTVSYSTMWCLFMLGLHPEIQDKVFKEVESSCHTYVTYEDMNSFTYLDAVVMETFRIYPTVPYFSRKLCKDVHFGQHKAQKGTTIVFPVYFWHRNPDIYPEPEKFDPDRFLNIKEKKPWQHMPFAEGTRVCVGKKYALIQMKVFLAHILRNFKITSLDKREDLQLCYNVVLTPSKPLRMLITPRSSTLSS